MEAFNAMMAADKIGRDQSSLRGGLVGIPSKHVEQEPQWYRISCSTPNSDNWLDVMRSEFQVLVDRDTFESPNILGGPRAIRVD